MICAYDQTKELTCEATSYSCKYKWSVFSSRFPCYRVSLSSHREMLKDVLPLLRSSVNPQVEYIIRTLRKWAKENRVALS